MWDKAQGGGRVCSPYIKGAEEAKLKEEVLNYLIHQWEENCESLEAEIVSLRTDLEILEAKKGLDRKFVEGERKLDRILNSQISL